MTGSRAIEGRTNRWAEGGRPRITIVGAGITGLAAAHRLIEIEGGPAVTVLEAGERPGGVLRTVHDQGFLIEQSADSFLTALPYGIDLCRRLGLVDDVIPTDSAHRRALVVSRGRLVPIPDGLMIMAPTRLWPMVTTPILGPWGKLRMGLEWFVAPGRDHDRDESLADFARRRFGREAYERLIQPLVGGMYTGDPERLSVRATMPRFLDMELAHGSLIRAALRERSPRPRKGDSGPEGSGARYGLFAGLRRGMSSLIDALVAKLPEGTLVTGVSVEQVARMSDGMWQIAGRENGRPFRIEADGLILATPAKVASRLLGVVDRELSAGLGRISSTSCAVVSLAYRREQVGHALDGFGFVVPKIEGRQILSGSFSSVKFPGRAPDGHVLLRTFLGGAFHPEVLDRDDESLCSLAASELAELLAIRGEPVLQHVSRWPEVMPQYELGHLGAVASIESRLADLPGLAVAGNAFRGVGVPQCIQSGEEAAERVAEACLRPSARTSE
jgi:oxygen-dependent protoporphyrinogen oxidase